MEKIVNIFKLRLSMLLSLSIPNTWPYNAMATLPDAWHYGISAKTGWPGASMLGLSETASVLFDLCGST